MKIAITFIMVCAICSLIILNMPNPDFTEDKGFPVLGQTIKGKFYPNPERKTELTELGEMVLESSEEDKLSNIMSAKNGTTRGWASIGATFGYNDNCYE